MVKKLLIILLALIVAGAVAGYYMWNKPHPKAEDQNAVRVTAVDLFHEYQDNAKAADARYLNKWLEISGTIGSLDTNLDGNVALILETGDLMSGVMCTMRDKDPAARKGDQITVKGRCAGLVMDVKVTDCILVR